MCLHYGNVSTYYTINYSFNFLIISKSCFNHCSIKTNAAFLCNFEVMQILQELKDSTQRKHKREGSLATVTYEVKEFLL